MITPRRQYALKFTTKYGITIQNNTEELGHALVWKSALEEFPSDVVTVVWRDVGEWTEDTVATPANREDPKKK